MAAARTRRPGFAYRPAVRAVSVVCALAVMLLYSLTRVPSNPKVSSSDHNERRDSSALPETDRSSPSVRQRHLLSSYEYDLDRATIVSLMDSDTGNDSNGTECTSPRDSHQNYNSTCAYVLEQCGDQAQLFDYLRFVLCDLSHVQVRSHWPMHV